MKAECYFKLSTLKIVNFNQLWTSSTKMEPAVITTPILVRLTSSLKYSKWVTHQKLNLYQDKENRIRLKHHWISKEAKAIWKGLETILSGFHPIQRLNQPTNLNKWEAFRTSCSKDKLLAASPNPFYRILSNLNKTRISNWANKKSNSHVWILKLLNNFPNWIRCHSINHECCLQHRLQDLHKLAKGSEAQWLGIRNEISLDHPTKPNRNILKVMFNWHLKRFWNLCNSWIN